MGDQPPDIDEHEHDQDGVGGGADDLRDVDSRPIRLRMLAEFGEGLVSMAQYAKFVLFYKCGGR